MAVGKSAKTAKGTTAQEVPCPGCGKPTRIVKRIKNRAQGISGGMFRSCTVCDYSQKL